MTLVKEVTAGVDWLTVRTIGFEGSHKLHLLSVKVLEENNVVLPAPRYAKLHQYEGWRAGGLGYMVNDDRAILSLAGSLAQKYLKQVAEIEATATRIALAVDVLLFDAVPVAALRFAQLVRFEKAGIRDGYKSRLVLMTGDDGSSTLYLGKRSSPIFARLYDKGVQSGAEVSGTLWRYEVEYKQDAARAVYESLVEIDRQRDYILARVHTHFQRRGVLPLFYVGQAAAMLQNRDRLKLAKTELNQIQRRGEI
jgi:hypothetical protein